MSQPGWRPLFRTPHATVTKVLHSPAFDRSRERAAADIGDPEALRRLADQVEGLDYDDAPLSAVADRVAAAIRLLRAKAEDIERDTPPPAADGEARERLLVASLYYLVTPVDLIPDFRAGGYIDDVLALSWIFGAAADVLDPYLDDDV